MRLFIYPELQPKIGDRMLKQPPAKPFGGGVDVLEKEDARFQSS